MVTSLRTSDSLASNESYFFAELKRLKMIIDRLQNGEKLFIILDEILKGTNSIDKQKGSLALMKQLVAYKACGIIATHDLSTVNYFLYLVLIAGRTFWISAIRVASLGCVLINSGVEPLFPADIFCQKLTATSGLYPAIVMNTNPI